MTAVASGCSPFPGQATHRVAPIRGPGETLGRSLFAGSRIGAPPTASRVRDTDRGRGSSSPHPIAHRLALLVVGQEARLAHPAAPDPGSASRHLTKCRHPRAWPGDPRLPVPKPAKSGMAGSSPAMTWYFLTGTKTPHTRRTRGATARAGPPGSRIGAACPGSRARVPDQRRRRRSAAPGPRRDPAAKTLSPHTRRTRGATARGPSARAVIAQTSASSRSGERPLESPSGPKSQSSSSSAGNGPAWRTLPCS